MMGFELIFIALLIGGLAYALGWRPPSNPMMSAPPKQTPLDVLKARYARGEIGREEFEHIRRDLDDPTTPARDDV